MTTKITWKPWSRLDGRCEGTDSYDSSRTIYAEIQTQEWNSSSPNVYVGSVDVRADGNHLYFWTRGTDVDQLKARLESVGEKLQKVVKDL